MRWWFLLILVLGCASVPRDFRYVSLGASASQPQQEHYIYLDKNFGEMDRLSIGDAVRQWNYALNGHVKITIVDTAFDMEVEKIQGMGASDWMILKIDSSNGMVVDDRMLAYVDKVGGRKMWIIRDRIQNEWVGGIVMHEMGHLLGIQHDDVYLMQKSYKWAEFRCIDYGTARLAARQLGLNIKQLNYCIYY